jgi:hypothetical protein
VDWQGFMNDTRWREVGEKAARAPATVAPRHSRARTSQILQLTGRAS